MLTMNDSTALWKQPHPTLRRGADQRKHAQFASLRLRLLPEEVILELPRPDVVVGRHSEADVRLTHPDVSRRHCRLAFVDGRWRVQDLNSLNGVYLNNERIVDATIYEGDRLRLGGQVLIVDMVNAGSANPQAELLMSIAQAIPGQPDLRQAS